MKPLQTCCWLRLAASLMIFYFEFVHSNRKPIKYHKIRHARHKANNDSLQIFQMEICDRQKFQIKCPTHTKISVEHSFYGNSYGRSSVCGQSQQRRRQSRRLAGGKKSPFLMRDVNFDETPCQFLNAPQKVKEHCQNKEECGFKVKPSAFGTLDSKCSKKRGNILHIHYKCRPIQFMSDYHCEDSQVDVKCRNVQQSIAVYSATYGRKFSVNAHDCGVKSEKNLVADCSADVTERLMQICERKNECTFNVTDNDMKIASPLCQQNETKKYLNFIYICVDENVFGSKLTTNYDVSFHKTWSTKSTKSFVDQSTSTFVPNTKSVVDSLDNSLNPMSDAAGVLPPIVEDVLHRRLLPNSNDKNYSMQVYKEAVKCLWSRVESTYPELRTCIPTDVPNFVSFVHFVEITLVYLKDNRDQMILYSCFSSIGGLILFLLVFVACKLCPIRKRRRRQTRLKTNNTLGVLKERTQEDNKSITASVRREVSFREPSLLNVSTLIDLDDLDVMSSSMYSNTNSKQLSRTNSTVISVRPYQKYSAR